ncbi:MAG: imidazolonepropionase, partial [Microbacteriaceae bacterium]|nr:imidazolonepropionase [Microbacteriaceae bacterium]
MSTLISNIGLLVTNEPERLERQDAALVIENDLVAWVGDSSKAPATDSQIDAQGSCVIPGFVDSHSHLIFAGDRSDEFEARMIGQKYEAGGIRRTVRLTREASDEALR